MPRRLRLTVAHSKKDGVWTLKGGSADQTFRTKQDAVRRAASEGRAHGHAQVIIKGLDGKIQSERTYGADPRRTPG
jgi:Uncharacterized protein conserved in bacteria (DUF2188)